MTEAGPVLAMCLAFAKEPLEIKSGACGTVVRNAEMKIIDPQTGVSLGRNQPGEICIRGDQIMKGTFSPISNFFSLSLCMVCLMRYSGELYERVICSYVVCTYRI